MRRACVHSIVPLVYLSPAEGKRRARAAEQKSAFFVGCPCTTTRREVRRTITRVHFALYALPLGFLTSVFPIEVRDLISEPL